MSAPQGLDQIDFSQFATKPSGDLPGAGGKTNLDQVDFSDFVTTPGGAAPAPVDGSKLAPLDSGFQGAPVPGQGRKQPAAIRHNNPGAMWDNAIAKAFGSKGAEKLNDGLGQNNQIAHFDDPVAGAAAQFALLAKNYTGMTLGSAIDKWSGGNEVSSYLNYIKQATGLTPNTKLTADFIFSPKGLALAKAMSQHEAGAVFPLNDQQWAQAQAAAKRYIQAKAQNASAGAKPGGSIWSEQTPSLGTGINNAAALLEQQSQEARDQGELAPEKPGLPDVSLQAGSSPFKNVIAETAKAAPSKEQPEFIPDFSSIASGQVNPVNSVDRDAAVKVIKQALDETPEWQWEKRQGLSSMLEELQAPGAQYRSISDAGQGLAAYLGEKVRPLNEFLQKSLASNLSLLTGSQNATARSIGQGLQGVGDTAAGLAPWNLPGFVAQVATDPFGVAESVANTVSKALPWVEATPYERGLGIGLIGSFLLGAKGHLGEVGRTLGDKIFDVRHAWDLSKTTLDPRFEELLNQAHQAGLYPAEEIPNIVKDLKSVQLASGVEPGELYNKFALFLREKLRSKNTLGLNGPEAPETAPQAPEAPIQPAPRTPFTPKSGPEEQGPFQTPVDQFVQRAGEQSADLAQQPTAPPDTGTGLPPDVMQALAMLRQPQSESQPKTQSEIQSETPSQPTFQAQPEPQTQTQPEAQPGAPAQPTAQPATQHQTTPTEPVRARSFLLGGNAGARNVGTLTQAQNDLYDLASKRRNASRGYGRAGQGRTDGGKTSQQIQAELPDAIAAAAQHLPADYTEGQIGDLADKVFDDIRAQAKAAGDGADWTAVDNVGIPKRAKPPVSTPTQAPAPTPVQAPVSAQPQAPAPTKADTPAPQTSQGHPGIDWANPRTSVENYRYYHGRIPTGDLGVRPGLQFKESEITNQEDQTGPSMDDIKAWDEPSAGVITAWEDRDGNIYALNGHHHRGLARRLKVGHLNVNVFSERDGITEQMARVLGALQNMREGKGTALDIAGILRESGLTLADLEKYGVSPKRSVAADAIALNKLTPDALSFVSTGKVSESVGAEIGKAGLSPERQIMAMRAAWNSHIETRTQAEQLAEAARVAPVKETEQPVLFGEAGDEELALGELAKIRAGVLSAIAQDKNFNRALIKAERAKQGQTNIDVEAQQSVQSELDEAHAYVSSILNTDPETATKLQEETRNYVQNPTKANFARAVAAVADVARVAAKRRANELRGLTPRANGAQSQLPPATADAGAGANAPEYGNPPSGLKQEAPTPTNVEQSQVPQEVTERPGADRSQYVIGMDEDGHYRYFDEGKPVSPAFGSFGEAQAWLGEPRGSNTTKPVEAQKSAEPKTAETVSSPAPEVSGGLFGEEPEVPLASQSPLEGPKSGGILNPGASGENSIGQRRAAAGGEMGLDGIFYPAGAWMPQEAYDPDFVRQYEKGMSERTGGPTGARNPGGVSVPIEKQAQDAAAGRTPDQVIEDANKGLPEELQISPIDKSYLEDLGITVTRKTAKNGRIIYEITGNTYGIKDVLKRELGASFYSPTKSWTVWSSDDPSGKLAELLRGLDIGNAGDIKSAGNSGGIDEAKRIAELRQQYDASPDTRPTRSEAVGAVSPETKRLLEKGREAGIPQDVVDDQIEDVGKIVTAFEKGKPLFLVTNEAGTGKTFVLGGAIRELRNRGIKKFVYATMNTDLFDQIRSDLKEYGTQDVEFTTYAALSDKKNTPPNLDGGVLILDESHNAKNIEEATSAKRAQRMMGDARMTILASATPYENPIQMGYLAGTGVFGDTPFKDFARAFGATMRTWRDGDEIREQLQWPSGETEGPMAAKNWLDRQGILTYRPMRLDPSMVESQFVKAGVDQKWVDMYNHVLEAYDQAMSGEEGDDGGGMARSIKTSLAMHERNTVKRILEASKVDYTIAEAKRILASKDANGNPKNVVIFVDTKSDRSIGKFRRTGDARGPLFSYPEIRQQMDEWDRAFQMAIAMHDTPPPPPFADFIVRLAEPMHDLGVDYELPSLESSIVEALGGPDKVAVYTGNRTQAAALKDKNAFLRGEKRAIVATMAKGGTGLSLHDKVGNRPTVQLNINLPWSPTKVDQVAGRVARYGLMSPAEIRWIFAPQLSVEHLLAGRVGRRMLDLGATVKGIESKPGQAMTDLDSLSDVTSLKSLVAKEMSGSAEAPAAGAPPEPPKPPNEAPSGNAEAEPGPEGQEPPKRERFVSDEAYEEAMRKLRSPGSGKAETGGFQELSERIKAMVTVALYYIENGVRDFAEWAKIMRDQVGEHLSMDELRQAWDHAMSQRLEEPMDSEVVQSKATEAVQPKAQEPVPSPSEPVQPKSVEAPKPPQSESVSPAKTKDGQTYEQAIGANNESVRAVLRHMNLPLPGERVPQKVQQWIDEALPRLHEAADIARGVLRDKDRLDNVTTTVLGMRIAQLAAAYDEAAKAGRDTSQIEAESSLLANAVQAAGTPWGREGVARRMLFGERMDYLGLKERVLKAREMGGIEDKTISDDLKAKLDQYAKDYADATKEIEAWKKRALEAEQFLTPDEPKGAKAPKSQPKPSAAAIDAIRKERQSLYAKLAKLMGRTFTGLDPEVVDTLAKLVGTYVREGTLGLNDAVEAIRNEFPEFSARQIRDAFTGYGDMEPPKGLSEKAKRIRDAIKLGRVLSETEDIQDGVKPWKRPKSEPSPIPPELQDALDKLQSLKDVGKLVVPYIRDGALSLDSAVAAVHAKFPEFSEREIRDAFSGYGNLEPPKGLSEKAKSVRNARRLGRILSETEDIQNGVKPWKRPKPEPSPVPPEIQDALDKLNAAKNAAAQTVAQEGAKHDALDYIEAYIRANMLATIPIFSKILSTSVFEIPIGAARELISPLFNNVVVWDGKTLKEVDPNNSVRDMGAMLQRINPRTYAKALKLAKETLAGAPDPYSNYTQHHDEIFGLAGRTHSAAKMLESTPEYESSFRRGVKRAIIERDNLQDPDVVQAIREHAQIDAMNAKFQGLNGMADALIGAPPKKGENPGARIARFIKNILIPFRRVPLNLAKATLDYTGAGLVRGEWLSSRARGGHFSEEMMTPEMAHEIRQAYVRGGIGLAIAVIGWLFPDLTGGFDDEDWDKKGRVYMTNPITGEKHRPMWRVFTEHPAIWALNFWGTMRHLYDKTNNLPEAVKGALGSGAKELATAKLPGMLSAINLSDALKDQPEKQPTLGNPRPRDKSAIAATRIVEGMLSPRIAANLAKAQDTPSTGKGDLQDFLAKLETLFSGEGARPVDVRDASDEFQSQYPSIAGIKGRSALPTRLPPEGQKLLRSIMPRSR